MPINCITEFYPEGDHTPCRDIVKIAKNYLKGQFWFHFIVWIPFHYILDFSSARYLKWTLAIKCARIIDGLELFNVTLIMNSVRRIFKKYMQYKV